MIVAYLFHSQMCLILFNIEMMLNIVNYFDILDFELTQVFLTLKKQLNQVLSGHLLREIFLAGHQL